MSNDEKGLATKGQLQQEIAVSEGGIVLRTLDDLWRIAEGIHRAKMAPNSLDTVDKIAIAILRGAEVGFKPMLSVTSIAVINGVPGWVTKAARALIRDSGLLKEGTDIEEGVRHAPGCPEIEDGKRCLDLCEGYCRTWRQGMLKSREHTFSVADAKQAGLWDKRSQHGKPSSWILYHKRMLMHRAAGFNFDDCWGDVLNGMTTVDVLQDHPQAAFARAGETVTINAEPPGRDPLLPRAISGGDVIDAPDGGGEKDDGAAGTRAEDPAASEPHCYDEDGQPCPGIGEPGCVDPGPEPSEIALGAERHTPTAEEVDAGIVAVESNPATAQAEAEMVEPDDLAKCESCPRSFKRSEEAHWPYEDEPGVIKYRCSSCGHREPIE